MSDEENRLITSLHERYVQQAIWTKENRRRLYAFASINKAERILEVGSGTGVITSELASSGSNGVFGIDIDDEVVVFAHRFDPASKYLVGDGGKLPFDPKTFNAVLCHFLLLWVSEPRKILHEMIRVAAPGGSVIAIAEPDYGGRIDFPAPLGEIGFLQAEALMTKGADIQIGRKLRSLFEGSGLGGVIVGVLGGEWKEFYLPDSFENEWDTIERDLAGDMPAKELSRYRELDKQASLRGERILYVPTFYAYGRVPFE
jgi:SAM-dependent methyltransferase